MPTLSRCNQGIHIPGSLAGRWGFSPLAGEFPPPNREGGFSPNIVLERPPKGPSSRREEPPRR